VKIELFQEGHSMSGFRHVDQCDDQIEAVGDLLEGVRHGAHLTLRYLDFVSNRLVLRPHNISYPVDLIEVDPDESPYDLIVGRVSLILNEP
jgi:hypothetical protein